VATGVGKDPSGSWPTFQPTSLPYVVFLDAHKVKAGHRPDGLPHDARLRVRERVAPVDAPAESAMTNQLWR
jgi:hypothetical protein